MADGQLIVRPLTPVKVSDRVRNLEIKLLSEELRAKNTTSRKSCAWPPNQVGQTTEKMPRGKANGSLGKRKAVWEKTDQNSKDVVKHSIPRNVPVYCIASPRPMPLPSPKILDQIYNVSPALASSSPFFGDASFIRIGSGDSETPNVSTGYATTILMHSPSNESLQDFNEFEDNLARACLCDENLDEKEDDCSRGERFQIVAATAAAGAVMTGTTTGVVTGILGTVGGAAVGVIPAFFTLGLSIPFCAAVGGGTGLCAGAVTGGSIGLVTGGAVGHIGYNRHKERKSR